MKKFKIATTNCGGFCQIGNHAIKHDFLGSNEIFSSYKLAAEKAQQISNWASQFDNSGFAALICRKKGTSWIVVAQL